MKEYPKSDGPKPLDSFTKHRITINSTYFKLTLLCCIGIVEKKSSGEALVLMGSNTWCMYPGSVFGWLRRSHKLAVAIGRGKGWLNWWNLYVKGVWLSTIWIGKFPFTSWGYNGLWLFLFFVFYGYETFYLMFYSKCDITFISVPTSRILFQQSRQRHQFFFQSLQPT